MTYDWGGRPFVILHTAGEGSHGIADLAGSFVGANVHKGEPFEVRNYNQIELAKAPIMQAFYRTRLPAGTPDGVRVATSTSFWTISRAFLSATPPRTRCGPCSTWCPGLPHADWCLQSDVMPDLGLQAQPIKEAIKAVFPAEGGETGLNHIMGGLSGFRAPNRTHGGCEARGTLFYAAVGHAATVCSEQIEPILTVRGDLMRWSISNYAHFPAQFPPF